MSPAVAGRLHGEIESHRPIRAHAGKISITGWCLNADSPEAPPVRLRTEAGILPLTARLARTDVPLFFPQCPAASHCGYVIEGTLPTGVYLAHFEAQFPDGSWQNFQTLSLVVDPAPFTAVLDEPIPTGILRDRVHVGGWALQPGETLTSLVLRYGHRELPCHFGLPRLDVPALFPGETKASSAGFESVDPLVAGHGPVRVRGQLASGRIVVAPTTVTFSIATDENHGPELDLTARRATLPDGKPVSAEPPARSSRPLNILFVIPGNLISNSALQVAALANELAVAGHDCVITAQRDPGTLAYHDAPRFRAKPFADAVADGAEFINRRGPDLIHAWTTRECVRLTSLELQRRYGGRLIVQLEDNEQEILAQTLQRPWAELAALPAPELAALITPDFSHPILSREFLAAADGITTIIDSLHRFVPEGKPRVTLWPAADPRYFFPRPTAEEFHRALQLDPATTILFYHGNTHASNAAEMRALYRAVLLLNQTGHATCLIRAGTDSVDFLGADSAEIKPHVIELGPIHTHRHLPPLMALADIFVQPGRADAFNDYRFPSKLPEFFALGRPVVLPRTNLGTSLRHGIDAYVLDEADADGIAHAVRELRRDRAMYERLAHGATAFAAQHFSWRRSAEALAKFYADLTT